ncbi:MAG: TonB-dependent receptor [Alphaproteobacteria bacterium]|nr:MAG: TonB-dependent receptor [Alphaproteobacteria bacterium]
MPKKGLGRRSLLAGAASIVALSTFAETSAFAVFDEIKVTATRRVENIRDVPLSVATKSGEALDTLFAGGQDILALAGRVPSLNVESSNGRVAPRFYIRGLGNTDFDLAASQPVSVIMDDVVLENVVLKSSPIFDIEQVEVLRGPQGTLFGRNTPAGIVKFTTVKPSAEKSGYLTGVYGEYNTLNLEGAVGGALNDDGSVTGRLSVLYQHRDDYIDNYDYLTNTPIEKDAMGGFDEFAGRAQLSIQANDDLNILFNVHARDLDGNSAAIFRANVFTPGSNKLNSNYDRDKVYFDGGNNNPQAYKGQGGSINITWDATDNFTVTSITAFETTDGSSRGDIDGGQVGAGPGFIPFPSDTEDGLTSLDQFTQEFRVASQNTDGYSWQYGFYYFDGEFDILTDAGFNAQKVTHTNEAWAVFGQYSRDFGEEWTVTGGIRFTDDEKGFSAEGWPAYTIKKTGNHVDWDLTAMWHIADELNLYGRVASGFRAPSIQGRDVVFFGAPSVADSETIMSYEIGAKYENPSKTFRINGAGYTYTIDDIQLSAVGGDANLIQLVNARQARGYGFEFDAEWAPTDNFLMTLGASLNHTEIDDPDLLVGICAQCTVTDPTVFVGPDERAVVDGNPLPQAPEWVYNMTARYGVPMGADHELFFFTDWYYQTEVNLFLYESIEFQTDDQFEGGLKIGYARNDGSYEVALFARNITDEDNVKGGIDFNNNTAYVNEPRIIGLSVSFRR